MSCIEGAAEDTALEVAGPKGGSTRFQFDHVFSGAASQGDVYDEVTHLVQSAMDGHNVCVFAYGQTGSGKTYTMDGPRGNEAPELRGVVLRAAAQVFASAKELGTLGWTFSFKASCVEVYNEELRDLLGGKGETKLKIQDSGGTVSIPGLKQVDVTDSAALQKMLDFAWRRTARRRRRSRTTRRRAAPRLPAVPLGREPEDGEDDGVRAQPDRPRRLRARQAERRQGDRLRGGQGDQQVALRARGTSSARSPRARSTSRSATRSSPTCSPTRSRARRRR